MLFLPSASPATRVQSCTGTSCAGSKALPPVASVEFGDPQQNPSLGQSLKGNCQLCSPSCSTKTGICAREGRKTVSAHLLSTEHKLRQRVASAAAGPEASYRIESCARGRNLRLALTCFESYKAFWSRLAMRVSRTMPCSLVPSSSGGQRPFPPPCSS